MYTRGKDLLNLMSHQEVVYKMCHDYDATYVGQMKH